MLYINDKFLVADTVAELEEYVNLMKIKQFSKCLTNKYYYYNLPDKFVDAVTNDIAVKKISSTLLFYIAEGLYIQDVFHRYTMKSFGLKTATSFVSTHKEYVKKQLLACMKVLDSNFKI